jgi:hypothetical protein
MQHQQDKLPALRESRLQLALQAIECDATLSQRRAARIYRIPRSTLSTRRAGTTFIIFQGKNHLSAWYEEDNLPHDWVIAVSENGWTTNALGLQ